MPSSLLYTCREIWGIEGYLPFIGYKRMVALPCARSSPLLEAAAGFLQSSTPTAADASPNPDVGKARARWHGAGCCGRPTGVDSGTWPGDSASMLPFMPGTSGTMKSLVCRCVNQVPLCESSVPASHSPNPTPGLKGTNPSSNASAALRSRLVAAGKFSVRPWLNQILANSELYMRSKSPGDPQGQLPGLAKRAKKAEEISLGAIQTLVAQPSHGEVVQTRFRNRSEKRESK